MPITEGVMAPDFALREASDGEAPRLASLRGQPVVIYFYPKDDTPGCTAEAKDFSCLAEDFAAAPAHVVGVSPDDARSHARFRDKHDLKIDLVSDGDKAIAEAYGVWVEKQMYGRTFMGVERATFLVDADGRVARVWRNVRVPGHADEVLAAVMDLHRSSPRR